MLKTMGIVIGTLLLIGFLSGGGFGIVVGIMGLIFGVVAGIFGAIAGIFGGIIGILAGLVGIAVMILIPVAIIVAIVGGCLKLMSGI